jgi:hypothetical protein
MPSVRRRMEVDIDVDALDQQLDDQGLLGGEEFLPKSIELNEGVAHLGLTDLIAVFRALALEAPAAHDRPLLRLPVHKELVMMLTCRRVSAITQPMDPVFRAFEGHAYGVDAADPGRAFELQFARAAGMPGSETGSRRLGAGLY